MLTDSTLVIHWAVRQGQRNTRRHNSQQEAFSDSYSNTVLVPDSFPPDKRQPDTNQHGSNGYSYLSAHPQPQSTLDPPTPSPITTNTTTTSTGTTTTRDSPSPSSIVAVSDQPPAIQLQQGNRSLTEYIRFGEGMRAQLEPCKREGDIVERFVAGLDDESVRRLVERRMDCVGWVWERMMGVLREVDGGCAATVMESEGAAAAAVTAGDNGGGRGRGRRGKRRRISIVSADEEDLLQMAGTHVG